MRDYITYFIRQEGIGTRNGLQPDTYSVMMFSFSHVRIKNNHIFYSFPIDIPVEHLERFYEEKLEVTRKFTYGMKLVQAELDKVMKEIEADKSSGPCKSYKNILAQ